MKTTHTILSLIFISNTLFAGEVSVARGKYIFNASGCMNCHTVDKSKPLAGGLKISTPFGVFYTPNISSDKVHGIGNWTDKEFLNAVKKGISPKGQYYYPSFTYTSYTKLTNDDVLSMKAYINTLPAMPDENKRHELKFPLNNRKLMFAWRTLNFKKNHLTKNEEEVFKYQGTFRPKSNKSKEWNNGAYLVEGALHCTECHTPRNLLGGLSTKKWMAGSPGFTEEEKAPNITSDSEKGLGNWTRENWKEFLTEGIKPDGVDVGGEMYKVIKNGTAKLTESDLDDVITYLESLKAISSN